MPQPQKVTLRDVTRDNWMLASSVARESEQRAFVADGMEILALGYVERRNNARVKAIYADETLVGLLLVEDLNEEPVCYHLHELLVDTLHQGKGYGTQAMVLLLAQLRLEGRFPVVEVCVHGRNAAAIAFFERNGFCMSDYIDPAAPWNRSMVRSLSQPCA